ncbi:MAG: restriction endonuclease [Ruminococcus sp.]|nr:restriction endonuclease [Ruminococcus sp.]
MSKIEEAKSILKELNVPAKQQADVCCYTLLAMANIHETDSWESATNKWIRIHDVIAFSNEHYGTTYAENSREAFRKQAMHNFRNAAFIEDYSKATNSPNYCYRLTEEMLLLIRSYGTDEWQTRKEAFLANHESLIGMYSSHRAIRKIPVKINGIDFTFSPGKHNQLQKAIIEEFAPRFAPGSECLYVGDTTEKDMVKNVEKLAELGFAITLHDKMPDVVLYSAEKNWIFFVESVTSVGPMDPKRIREIEEMTRNVTAGKIYITAFLDFKTYKKFSDSLAWDTEVWLAENPDHMIHLNGDRFLGPRTGNN